MADFETHPINTVNKLRQEIRDLKDGSCRFNCRTAKSAFMAGFDAGADDAVDSGKIIDDDFYREVTEQAWQKHKGAGD